MAKKAAVKSKAGSSSEKGQKTLSSSVSYKDQKVYCTKCGESFKTYTTLKNHLFKVHIGDLSNAKKFFCDACKKIFKKLGMLKIHLTKFHPNGYSKEPAETFSCNNCDGTFKRKDNLIFHNIAFHNSAWWKFLQAKLMWIK